MNQYRGRRYDYWRLTYQASSLPLLCPLLDVVLPWSLPHTDAPTARYGGGPKRTGSQPLGHRAQWYHYEPGVSWVMSVPKRQTSRVQRRGLSHDLSVFSPTKVETEPCLLDQTLSMTLHLTSRGRTMIIDHRTYRILVLEIHG